MSEAATASLGDLMKAGDTKEQQEIIGAFETLHAVVTPDKCAIL